jgi:hypothetical protein
LSHPICSVARLDLGVSSDLLGQRQNVSVEGLVDRFCPERFELVQLKPISERRTPDTGGGLTAC